MKIRRVIGGHSVGISLMMGQLARYLIAASIPTVLLLVWAIRATPTEAAFTGMLVGLPVTLILTLAAKIKAVPTSEGSTPAPAWPVILAGTVATAMYWF